MSNKSQQLNVNISISTILKVVGVLAAVWFMYFIKEILLLFFISIFVAALVNNGVKYFSKYIKNRTLTVILIYAIVVLIFSIVFAVLIPVLITQISELHSNWPHYTSRLLNFVPDMWHDRVSSFLQLESINWQSTMGELLETLRGFFGGVFNLIVVFALSFYMSLEEKAWDKVIKFILPKKYYKRVVFVLGKIEKQLSYWFQAQLTLCVIVSLLAYIGLKILGVKFALVLAMLAFIGEIIPYLGPIVSTFFATLFASLHSPLIMFLVFIWFIIINQLENHVLVPNIMKKAVGLNPIITILALLIGVEIAGIAGALLAIPIATILGVVVEDLYENK